MTDEACTRHETEHCDCDDCQLRAFLRTSPDWLRSNYGGPAGGVEGFMERLTLKRAGAGA